MAPGRLTFTQARGYRYQDADDDFPYDDSYNAITRRSDYHGLPEYLFYSYEHTLPLESSSSSTLRTLLASAETNEQVTYPMFRIKAESLAYSLEHTLGVLRGDTIVVLAGSNINIPIIALSSWIIGASILALPPNQGDIEYYNIISQHAMPIAIFVNLQWLSSINELLVQLTRAGNQELHVIIIDSIEHVSQSDSINNLEPNIHIWSLSTLYNTEHRQQIVPLSANEANEITAISQYTYNVLSNGEVSVQPNPLSHSNVISLYNSMHRDSLSLPPSRTNSRPPTPEMHTTPTPNTSFAYSTMVPSYPGLTQQDIARAFWHPTRGVYERDHISTYAVLRMYRAFRMHPVILNIFCKGASYIVARKFVPLEFARCVRRYHIERAELTNLEIVSLAEALAHQQLGNDRGEERIAGMLQGLRCIYTESETAELQLLPILNRFLPEIDVVRTMFGTYLDPVLQRRNI